MSAIHATRLSLLQKRLISQWKGPAKILGQDGPELFLRHGARYIKAHICRVKLTSPLKSKHSEKKDISKS